MHKIIVVALTAMLLTTASPRTQFLSVVLAQPGPAAATPSFSVGPQYDTTHVGVGFENHGRRVMLNFILVNGPEGWLITDVESPHDSLRMFLEQLRN